MTQGEQRIQQAEAQRAQALAHGDAASAKAAERNKTAWTRHLSDAKKRESRYQKSARDVDAVRRRKPQAELPPHSALFLRRHEYAARAKAQRRRRRASSARCGS